VRPNTQFLSFQRPNNIQGGKMPFFKIETNQQPNPGEIQSILKKSSEFISEMLEKPENYVMVSIEAGKQMMFGGNNHPTAFVKLKSIGLPVDRCAEFSGKICAFLSSELDIEPDRIFIGFMDLERNMFGWNGKTF
jgi:phenylpyruvate tautomerase PptA (4-oxalocrotonate tautomerase family)